MSAHCEDQLLICCHYLAAGDMLSLFLRGETQYWVSLSVGLPHLVLTFWATKLMSPTFSLHVQNLMFACQN